METDPVHYPIVGAQNEVKKLKNQSLKIIHEWHRIYGEFYKKLNFAMEYLKSCKTVSVSSLSLTHYTYVQWLKLALFGCFE